MDGDRGPVEADDTREVVDVLDELDKIEASQPPAETELVVVDVLVEVPAPWDDDRARPLI